jgi:hypothetical protein
MYQYDLHYFIRTFLVVTFGACSTHSILPTLSPEAYRLQDCAVTSCKVVLFVFMAVTITVPGFENRTLPPCSG